ncbi:hypothetical protein ASZ78_006848 [Callipepla squamata]|uniref:Ig-like domain-containing protein n=1 Tax=Callipepla squamata TaxID=9009 RepID=A0A226MDJ9_CALSU|nr:hypothetical protein ASZ78_006848 [Callipepla squamata]
MVMASRFQHTRILHIILFLQIVHLIKGQVHIVPPNNPVIAVFGKGVVLPCQLEAKTISGGLFVQWIFTGKSPNIDVTSYDGKNTLNPVKEDKTYQGRTHFFQTEINKGNLSLHLRDVMISDKGKYICSVTLENWYDEVVVDLDVAAQGDESAVFLDGHIGQGIGLNCKSQGWFPEPEVVWLDSKGQTRKEKVVTQNIKTSLGLFDVVSSMTLEPGSDMEVSCRIVSDILNTASESRVLISEMSEMKRRLGVQEPELVPITVSPECHLIEIHVPGAPDVEGNTCDPAGLSSPSTVPVLVAKEGFSSGKNYWEVEVGQQQDWVLGVTRQKGKQGQQGTLAGEDFWALHRSPGEIFSIKGNIRLEKTDVNFSVIGVLLDLEEAQIYFYGTDQKSPPLKIPMSFEKDTAEVFYPFLSKGEGRFKPVCYQNIPVPLKDP